MPAAQRHALLRQLASGPALPVAARWTACAQWHLTLRFIGEVDEEQCAAICRALGGVRAAPLRLRLRGMGSFGGGAVLWCGVQEEKAGQGGGHSSLQALHTAVQAALARAGVPPEARRFTPHLTLARLRRPLPPPNALRAWLAAHAALASTPFPVRRFALYRSELHRSGARHFEVQSWALGNDK